MILLPSQPKITEKEGNSASFEIEGLYPGYGVTVGNSIRRVLLSSLEGAAVTSVKIKGVQHEFSTIPGVKEDVINILLNLKQLRFKVWSEEPQNIILSVKGEKQVKGSDFKLPAQVELMNKDAKICTLTSKSSQLEMEILVGKGMGYEPVERRKKEKLAIGEIPLDAIYSPVRKVSFSVENMRVGERTDFDRLKMDIETDGTLSPETAMAKAAEILINHFDLIKNAFPEEKPKEKDADGKEEKDAAKTKIEDMKISTRTIHALENNNIKTAGGLARKSEEDILALEGMGEEGLKEIKKALKKLGFELKK
jgi:DNA-directed RNA polymerase subunit alpha